MSKVKGLKAGDKVRISFDGIFGGADPLGQFLIRRNPSDPATFLAAFDVADPSFTIEKIPGPLAVGDNVDTPWGEQEVMLIDGIHVVLRSGAGPVVHELREVSLWKRIP